MSVLSDLKELAPNQRNAVVASFLGWTLDAFDFFILVFVLKDIAREFATDITAVTIAITLTLAMRPLGALIFGYAADRYGRRPVLMVDVALFAALEFASGFAPSLTVLIVLRALYGIAMGGEWGVGASLAMESIPAKTRGVVSGLLQAGYPTGYLLAALVFGLLFDTIGWRGMFMVGAAPALVVLFIRRNVEESPVFVARAAANAPKMSLLPVLRAHLPLFVFSIALMTAFNFLSHGTQDLYPTYLEVQRGFDTSTVSIIAIVYNIGAIVGGIFFGALSERIGRRRAIVIAALLALPVIPLWAFTSAPVLVAAGAFLMQVAVQGAWGVIPAHLNELSPDEVRGTFPGVVYQLGNLFASANATIQAGIAEAHGNDYSLALALTAGIVAVIVALFAGFGFERKGVQFGTGTVTPAQPGMRPDIA